MSTRAIIARRKGDGFAGVYHHWDGYPSGLGATLWELHERRTLGELPAMLDMLIDKHPAGWSTINEADWSQEPGWTDDGKLPCADCGQRGMASHYRQYLKRPSAADKAQMAAGNYLRLGHSYREPATPKRPACFCHGDRSEEANPVTHDDDQGMEWAYVFDEETGTMVVCERVTVAGHNTGWFGTLGSDLGHWAIRLVARLGGPEPDWKGVGE